MICARVTSGSGLTAPAGGVHGTFGAGDAPAIPFTRGVPQARAHGTTPMKTTWRSLLGFDIIPNTRFTAVLLVCNKVLCRAPLHYIWRFALVLRSQ